MFRELIPVLSFKFTFRWKKNWNCKVSSWKTVYKYVKYARVLLPRYPCPFFIYFCREERKLSLVTGLLKLMDFGGYTDYFDVGNLILNMRSDFSRHIIIFKIYRVSCLSILTFFRSAFSSILNMIISHFCNILFITCFTDPKLTYSCKYSFSGVNWHLQIASNVHLQTCR